MNLFIFIFLYVFMFNVNLTKAKLGITVRSGFGGSRKELPGSGLSGMEGGGQHLSSAPQHPGAGISSCSSPSARGDSALLSPTSRACLPAGDALHGFIGVFAFGEMTNLAFLYCWEGRDGIRVRVKSHLQMWRG